MKYKKNSNNQLQEYDPSTGKYGAHIFDPKKDSMSNLIALQYGGSLDEFPVKFPEPTDLLEYIEMYIDIMRKKAKFNFDDEKFNFILLNKRRNYFRHRYNIDENNIKFVKNDILEHYKTNNSKFKRFNEYGIIFNVKMFVYLPYRMPIKINTGWMLDENNELKLVTIF